MDHLVVLSGACHAECPACKTVSKPVAKVCIECGCEFETYMVEDKFCTLCESTQLDL